MNEFAESDPWSVFLLAVEQELPRQTMDSYRQRAGSVHGQRLILPIWLADLDKDGALSAAIASDDLLRAAFSPDFILRLSQWFGRLFTDDPHRVFEASVPDLHLFLGLQPSEYSDETGNWLWTRLTQTSLESWPESSLVHEWDWQARDETRGFSRRILGERVIQPGVISNAVLERLSSNGAEIPAQGFDPEHFVERAVDLLKGGDPRGAANIFTGLTELRPTDALAWNNLGFCQLAYDPAAALQSFGKSAIFGREGLEVRLVNQVLALHLLGRDDDALLLAKELPEILPAPVSAWLWIHTEPAGTGALEPVQNFHLYVRNLVDHIRGYSCDRGVHRPL
ncbi:hypothetical protein LJR013_000989 [Pseudarthrobacter oxydans]|uniref:hypothetical protein n=1 Tax=Pseudarthrobacter oxydans TaxID=1671 RepID=UPI003ECFF555